MMIFCVRNQKGLNILKLPSTLAWVLLGSGVIANVMTIYWFVNNQLLMALNSHFIAALLYPWPTYHFISSKYQKNALILVLFLLFCLFIPLIANIGILITLTIGSYFSKNIEKKTYVTIDIPSIPENIIDQISYVKYLDPNLRSVLEYFSEPEERIQAVLATRKMDSLDSIPILKIALLDPIDEIRLLAYSMLNNKEKQFSAAIQSHLSALESDVQYSAREQATKQSYIAEAYWELSYLGLEQGQTKIHILQQADFYATMALKTLKSDCALYILRGRVALELGKYSQAKKDFALAIKYGASQEKLASYQAELAFAERRFQEVREYMLNTQLIAERSTLSGMAKQWL